MGSSRYKLPEGENSLSQKFEALCATIPEPYLEHAREHVLTRLEEFSKNDNPLLFENLREAVWLASRCQDLLAQFTSLSEHDKPLAVGAIRYFIVHVDSINDSTPGIGFRDDILVMNHVLERVGLEALTEEDPSRV